jgi:hypothetical protein
LRNPVDLRERYGEIYALELPDGQFVPFSLLSLSDYFSYTKALSADIIPRSILENEIFSKCVVDEVLVEDIYKQKAGTPTVVADTILQYSAPRSPEELNYFLNYNREIVNEALYQIVNIICLGFPAYTPDDILSKDIQDIFFLLALAERKMLETGALQEPLDFGGEKPKKRRKKPKVDVSKLKDIYKEQGRQEYNVHKLKSQGKEIPKVVKENETPKFEDNLNEDGEVLISAQELRYNNSGGALEEEDIQMIKEAQHIYGDYFEKLKKGEKIKIKSEEERLVEAKKRLEENRKRFREQIKKSRK